MRCLPAGGFVDAQPPRLDCVCMQRVEDDAFSDILQPTASPSPARLPPTRTEICDIRPAPFSVHPPTNYLYFFGLFGPLYCTVQVNKIMSLCQNAECFCKRTNRAIQATIRVCWDANAAEGELGQVSRHLHKAARLCHAVGRTQSLHCTSLTRSPGHLACS